MFMETRPEFIWVGVGFFLTFVFMKYIGGWRNWCVALVLLGFAPGAFADITVGGSININGFNPLLGTGGQFRFAPHGTWGSYTSNPMQMYRFEPVGETAGYFLGNVTLEQDTDSDGGVDATYRVTAVYYPGPNRRYCEVYLEGVLSAVLYPIARLDDTSAFLFQYDEPDPIVGGKTQSTLWRVEIFDNSGIAGDGPATRPTTRPGPATRSANRSHWATDVRNSMTGGPGLREGDADERGLMVRMSEESVLPQNFGFLGSVPNPGASTNVATDIGTVANLWKEWPAMAEGPAKSFYDTTFGGPGLALTRTVAAYEAFKTQAPAMFTFVRVVGTGLFVWHFLLHLVNGAFWALGVNSTAWLTSLRFGDDGLDSQTAVELPAASMVPQVRQVPVVEIRKA